MGAIIDGSCISWGYDKCGKKTSCNDYDVDQMSWILCWLGFGTSGIKSYFDVIFYQGVKSGFILI